MCGSCDGIFCGFAWDPETVTCRFGTAVGSGIYSLALRFLVWCATFSLEAAGMEAEPSSGIYTLRLEAEVGLNDDASIGIDVSAGSSPMLPSLPRDLGGVPLRSFFQGPGESAESSGLGRGVMSPMAEMTGLGMRLLAALPGAAPMLWERAVLRLGVLDIG